MLSSPFYAKIFISKFFPKYLFNDTAQFGPNLSCSSGSCFQFSSSTRLEEYFLRDEVEQTLALCVAELDIALESDELHQAGYWIGQICANLNRFADISEKWVPHPMVDYALRNSTQGLRHGAKERLANTCIGLNNHAKSRSSTFVSKLRQAMSTIEGDIEQNEGLYPYNAGRLTKAELCRRAGRIHRPAGR